MTMSDGPAWSQAGTFHDPTSYSGSTDALPDGHDDLVAPDLPSGTPVEPDAGGPLTPGFDPMPRNEAATDFARPVDLDTWSAEGNDTARMDPGPDGSIRTPWDAERVRNDGLDASRGSVHLTSGIYPMSQSSLRHDDIVQLDVAPADNSAVDRHAEDIARDNLADWRYWNDPVYGFWARLKRAFDESQIREAAGHPCAAESGRTGDALGSVEDRWQKDAVEEDPASFAGLIDVEEFSADPVIADRLSRAREYDIGGYRSLTARGEYGRTDDGLDSDEILQNLYVRKTRGVTRHDPLLADNPAVALRPEEHRRIRNLKASDLPGRSAEDVVRHHLEQMKDFLPHDVRVVAEREALKFIQREDL
ncbi:hypothetical protein ACI79G_16005 [Geodermatophilus sp. SYSU D00779]